MKSVLSRVLIPTALAFAVQAAWAADIEVKIGLGAPLSGGSAAYGKDIENGVRIALDEANAQNIRVGAQTVHFVLDSQDDQGDPRIGVQAAQKLVDDGVTVVIGHFNSGICIPASTIYARANVAMITPAASAPGITSRGLTNVFRTLPQDAQNAALAGQYAVKGLKAKRIAILDDRTAFGQGEADEFEKAVKAEGGTVVAREFTNDKAVDFSSQLTVFKSQRADLVYFGALDQLSANLVKKMKQLNMPAQFLGGGGIVDDVFLKLAGSAAEGAQAYEYGQPLTKLPQGPAFIAKYKKQYGQDVLAYAPFAYDATWTAIKAMQAAGTTDSKAVIEALHKISVEGVTGKIEFNAAGDLKRPVSTLYQVQDNKWVPMAASVN
ncbi:branched-chain amino acid ABC transporter substrate-binding protein [Caballeronia sp. SL2Y3]|uniref:branched-chain amino acid ABC transporter substrate-binding protein n=1 Tax=Caballeronia sp. SL2Y3 TaxID=2878151 RepID=UPI001FD5C284|nr:branched-chain amino acid ABC transporter substrate-binding protein [Caballeronia sp. SL2Y3]